MFDTETGAAIASAASVVSLALNAIASSLVLLALATFCS